MQKIIILNKKIIGIVLPGLVCVFLSCLPEQTRHSPIEATTTTNPIKAVDETCLKKCLQESMAHAVAWDRIEENCRRRCKK